MRFYPPAALVGASLTQSWNAGATSHGFGGGFYKPTYAASSANSDPLKGIKHVSDGPSGGHAVVTIYLK